MDIKDVNLDMIEYTKQVLKDSIEMDYTDELGNTKKVRILAEDKFSFEAYTIMSRTYPEFRSKLDAIISKCLVVKTNDGEEVVEELVDLYNQNLELIELMSREEEKTEEKSIAIPALPTQEEVKEETSETKTNDIPLLESPSILSLPAAEEKEAINEITEEIPAQEEAETKELEKDPQEFVNDLFNPLNDFIDGKISELNMDKEEADFDNEPKVDNEIKNNDLDLSIEPVPAEEVDEIKEADTPIEDRFVVSDEEPQEVDLGLPSEPTEEKEEEPKEVDIDMPKGIILEVPTIEPVEDVKPLENMETVPTAEPAKIEEIFKPEGQIVEQNQNPKKKVIKRVLKTYADKKAEVKEKVKAAICSKFMNDKTASLVKFADKLADVKATYKEKSEEENNAALSSMITEARDVNSGLNSHESITVLNSISKLHGKIRNKSNERVRRI